MIQKIKEAGRVRLDSPMGAIALLEEAAEAMKGGEDWGRAAGMMGAVAAGKMAMECLREVEEWGKLSEGGFSRKVFEVYTGKAERDEGRSQRLG